MSGQAPSRIWRLSDYDGEAVARLARALNLMPWQAHLLIQRGITSDEQARDFLDPKLSALSPPLGMHHIDRAAEIIFNSLKNQEIIGIAGDYDTDGITATALLVEFLGQVGARVLWYLPHRLEDGYGFSVAAARYFYEQKAKLIITVDCGMSDHQGVEEGKRLGMKVIVTDHHQIPPGPLVPADAVVNPHQEQCAFTPNLTGVGLAFYLAAALRARLQRDGHFKNNVPNLRQTLDLVALGTCADVVPLVGENRILVNEGLKVINSAPRLGIKELGLISRAAYAKNGPFDARDLSFSLIPRLNAAGRMDHPEIALKLLLSKDEEQARPLARELDQLNQERRKMEDEILSQATQMWRNTSGRCLVLAGQGWHRGVLGIVANRLVDLSGKPCLLLALDDSALAVGSGRSVKGIDLQQALVSQAHLLERYGGHSMAVGLSLNKSNIAQLRQGLDTYLQDQPHVPRVLNLDAEVEISQLNGRTIPYLDSLAPFGAGNPEPCLLLRRVEMQPTGTVSRHLRLNLRQGGKSLNAIAFGAAQRPAPVRDRLYDVACWLRVSSYMGRNLELVVEDWRLTEG